MFSKYFVPALAAANVLGGVEAAANHRHLHRRQYDTTEVDVVTDWVTVTVYGDEPSSTSAASVPTSSNSAFAAAEATAEVSSSSLPATSAVASTPSTTSVAPTTLVTSLKPTTSSASEAFAAAAITSSTTSSVVPTTSSTSTSAAAATTAASSSSGSKRGLAYNDPTLVSAAVGMSSKFGWSYNWGSTSDGLSTDIEFVPMLWGSNFVDSWSSNAQSAIDSGSSALLSFNEPDNSGQANLSPADAASLHQQYMNPFSGKASIGAPAITSSAASGAGIDWLNSFISACDGKCDFDFCPVHWYGPGGSDGASTFMTFVEQAHEACGKPIWVTEFGTTSGDTDSFMSAAISSLESTSYVDKYSYFYLAVGYLMESSSSFSSYGQIYADN